MEPTGETERAAASFTRIAALASHDKEAANELLAIIYQELRRLAAKRISQEKPGQTLQATALVHEAYIRLTGGEPQMWDGRAHFFGAAAEAMRRILVENARRKQRIRHGGGRQRFELEDADLTVEPISEDLLALDEALNKLAAEDHIKAELVKLRFFAGMSVEEAAQIIDISRATADRYWAYARAWLYREITKGEQDTRT